MLFPTIDFAVFFVIVLTGSWMLRPYAKVWRWFLLVSGCVFYLDPFNPTASDGRQTVVWNWTILAMLLAAGVATYWLLKVAFPERKRVDVVEAVDAGGRHILEGDDGRDVGHETDDTNVLEVDWSARGGMASPPIASVIAPIAVVGILAATSIWMQQTFPGRPDQSWRWLFLLVGIALVNQTFAKAVFAALGPRRERTSMSKGLVRSAIVVNLAVLGYFKYTNFLFDLPVFSSLTARLGLSDHLDILLPLAISFFIFQAISYVVDVGRGELHPIPLLDFCVYLTFFAHVVAGPIVRVPEFAPQLDSKADPRYVEFAEAFQLIFRGLFKKVVVSSFLATTIVDPVFNVPTGHSRAEVALAIYGYAIQIYADFSGYTDIAIGVALLLGIRFPQNFNAPYKALSIQDFWRRWHMTLSRWLRDYLYIPLGGSRKGEGRTYTNLYLTMLLGGLWHGASLSFLIWGSIHGAWLAGERYIKPLWKPIGLPSPVVKFLQWFVTFHVVCLGWVFFRTGPLLAGDNLWDPARRGLNVLGQLFSGDGGAAQLKVGLGFIASVIVLSVISQFVPQRFPDKVMLVFSRLVPIMQVVIVAAALVLIEVLGPEGISPFIYFQF